jgi:two-component system, cell cycle response regulator
MNGPTFRPPPSGAETQLVEVEPMSARRNGILTIASGLEAGKLLRLPTEETVLLGRSPECSFAFDDASLSRVHARVMRVGSEYFLRDEGSRNGTFVNNIKLERPQALRNGDRIQLGLSTLLRFSLADAQEEAALRKVYEAAILDGLTGIYNRKYFEDRIVTELSHAERHGTPLAVIISDIDHFKKVNDTYGHLAGDAVLVRVATLLKETVRPEDVLARYGGEEFVILMRGAKSSDALALAERIRASIEATTILFDGTPIRLTSSGGVASTADPGQACERAALLHAADTRLYQAKQSGRNRIIGP